MKSDDKIRESVKRFFKEPVTVYGIKTSDVTNISKAYQKEIITKSKAEQKPPSTSFFSLRPTTRNTFGVKPKCYRLQAKVLHKVNVYNMRVYCKSLEMTADC